MSSNRRKRKREACMHPQNKYAENPPDFAALASMYPTLSQYVFYTPSGKAKIDWTDFNATRELTRILLWHDFGVQWWIPDGQLCPTIPNRANYIHWIQDLLSSCPSPWHSAENVTWGLDIGTGANCIYPLLGACIHGWHFVGTDVTDMAVQWAQWNVHQNSQLVGLISIRNVKEINCVVDKDLNQDAAGEIEENGNGKHIQGLAIEPIKSASNSKTFDVNNKHAGESDNAAPLEIYNVSHDEKPNLLECNTEAVQPDILQKHVEPIDSAADLDDKFIKDQSCNGREFDVIELTDEHNEKSDDVCSSDLPNPVHADQPKIINDSNQLQILSVQDATASEELQNFSNKVGEPDSVEHLITELTEVVTNAEGLRDNIDLKGELQDTHALPILYGVVRKEERFDFCMCNPPFFESMEEAGANPRTACGGTPAEMVYPGGEEGFITKIIEDSSQLKHQIHWFTTMVGRKVNLKRLISKLRKKGVSMLQTTEFVQGRTARWGLAWSFSKCDEGLLSQKAITNKTKHMSFTLQGIPQRFRVYEVLQTLGVNMYKFGVSYELDAVAFLIKGVFQDKMETQLPGVDEEITSQSAKDPHFVLRVFEQTPGTLLVKGNLLKEHDRYAGTFYLMLTSIQKIMKEQFCGKLEKK